MSKHVLTIDGDDFTPSACSQVFYEMFDKEELKDVAQEAFGKGEVSLKGLTQTVAKAWKVVKTEGGKAAEREENQVRRSKYRL